MPTRASCRQRLRSVAAASAAYTALSSVFMNSAWQTPISQVTGIGSNNSNVVLANNLVLPELKDFLTARLDAAGLTDPANCAGSSSILCNGYNLGIAAGNAVTPPAPTTGRCRRCRRGC